MSRNVKKIPTSANTGRAKRGFNAAIGRQQVKHSGRPVFAPVDAFAQIGAAALAVAWINRAAFNDSGRSCFDDRLRVAQISPVDIGSLFFATHYATRFPLDLDGQLFAADLAIGDVGEVFSGRSAALGKAIPLARRQPHEK